MQLESRYNLYLDYSGYQIEPRSYRASPAPLMGTKFTTGRSAYSDLDFWQIGAVTDFSKGINQKYMVDPSMSFYSQGLNLSKPGELTLERDTETFTGLPGTVGKITAHFRRLGELYLGDDEGHIMKSTNGVTFTTKKTITDSDKTIYNFYEIAGRLFVTTGTGYIYVNEDPDHSDVWTKEAISTQFPLPDYDQTPDNGYDIHGTTKAAETFKVPMSGNTFETLKVKLKKTASPSGNIVFTIHEEDIDTVGEPGIQVTGASFSITAASVGTSYAWEEKDITAFDLRAGVRYYLVAEASSANASNYFTWGYEEGSKGTYDSGNGKEYDGTDWTDKPYRSYYFELRRLTIADLYYVMVESDYAFGWFGDGIRRSVDGYNWIPEPPDPLWVMPSNEGVPLNAVAIPKSFISGSHSGLWSFVGGSSGINLWSFPDYSNPNNFRGLEKWGHYAIFSIENQGLYYTDGSQVIPTTITYLGEGFKFQSCKHIHSNGWDIYALVSDNGTDWYLARANMNYHSQPKYWWIVKKLNSEPKRIVGWDDDRIFIFYENETAETFDKINGPYVEEGHMITSWIDENMIKILKMYNNLNAIFSEFPGDSSSANSTYAKLSYLVNRQANYINSSTVYGNPEQTEMTYSLPNPTLGNRIKIKLTIGRPTTDDSIAPIITDLTWKYILQKPAEDVAVKKSFTFIVLAEDLLEDYLENSHIPSEPILEQRSDILSMLWETSAKKEVLNFISPDNKSEIGIKVTYEGSGTGAFITIDRTNYTMSNRVTNDLKFSGDANIGGGIGDYCYKDKTLAQVVSDLNTLWGPDFTFEVHHDQDSTRSANDLEPRKDMIVCNATYTAAASIDDDQFTGNARLGRGSSEYNTYLMVGSDVHAVIMGTNSPSQSKLELDGRGSDRLQITLREA